MFSFDLKSLVHVLGRADVVCLEVSYERIRFQMLDEEPRGRWWWKATQEADLKTEGQQKGHVGPTKSKSISQSVSLWLLNIYKVPYP